MTFLQPFILFALPLIALPILIHLINQRRHRTVHWAATMFLLRARQMARGMAKIKAWLILVARMLAVTGLLLAVSRPMAGGWLGLTASHSPELTIIVLDRSASMEEMDPGTGRSKRLTALTRLTATLSTLGRQSRVVLFDSATGKPLELTAISQLTGLPEASGTETAADLPALLQDVAEYLRNHDSGRTDIWICSDLRQSDWQAADARWDTVRAQLRERSGVKIYLLAYAESAGDNLSVSLSGVHRRESGSGAELVMDLKVDRHSAATAPVTIPATVVVNGARSTLSLELTGRQLVLNGHSLPLDRQLRSGWGWLELPRDVNLRDNTFRFVFADPPVRKTVIVADDPRAGELLRLAAKTPADPQATYAAEVLTVAEAARIDWNQTALLVWQAPLPQGELAQQLQAFVSRGGCILFFPPIQPDGTECFGTRWEQWVQAPAGGRFAISRWRTDADLLQNTQSGAPLPVGQLMIHRCCGLLCPQGTVLAQLEQGPPLLVRAPTDQGAVWFLTASPVTESSNLAANGIIFYVLLQRALSRGAASLGAARQLDCGDVASATLERMQPLDAESSGWLLSEREFQGGLYEQSPRLLALNRPLSEDLTETLTTEMLDAIFNGLDFTRIDDRAGGSLSLASEVWRTFLILMILALLAEAILCLPEKTAPAGTLLTRSTTPPPARPRAPQLSS